MNPTGRIMEADGKRYELRLKESGKWSCHGCNLFRGLECCYPKDTGGRYLGGRSDCDNDGVTPLQWIEVKP